MIIIAMSGKKGAGKNQLFLDVKDYFDALEITVQECSFADTLKDFCIETLGLTYEQCYGSDEQKNSPTHYYWENVGDEFIRWRFSGMRYRYISCESDCSRTWSVWNEIDYAHTRAWFWSHYFAPDFVVDLKSGPMTGREIMQLFGTDLVRKTFGNVWADATIRRIIKHNSPVAVITDNRFPNEVNSVLQQSNGFVIRLTRNPHGGDGHPSENALDNFDWTRDKCFVLDNSKMSIEEQRKAIIPILDEINKRSKGAD